MATETQDTPETETTTEQSAGDQQEGLESAINEAIDQETPEPKEPKADEASGDSADPASEAKAGQAAQTPEAKAAADKAAAEAAAKPKEPDAVNDPIPEGLKKETKERMQSLVTKVKETTAQVEKVQAERDEILGYIAESTATPEQYTRALGYLKAVNSGDPAQIRTAISTVQAELRALAASIGEAIPGVDLLSEHQDLQDAVSTGTMTIEHANELAAARTARATREAQTAQATEQTQAQKEAQVALEDGKAALNALEAALKADPHYAAKREQLIPKLQTEFAKLHPSKWAARWAEEYAKIPNPTAQVVPLKKPAEQPLRPRQPAGGGVKAASSLEEAINQGIEEASGR